MSILLRSLALLATTLTAACDYDIPSLVGGGGATGVGGAGGGCVFEGCVACADGQFCDPGAGCVECNTASDCTNTDRPFCDHHRCVECTPNELSKCVNQQTCVEGQCDQPCQTAGDCVGPQDCVLSRCVECANNANCAQKFDVALCDVDAGRCVECLNDEDCLALENGTSRCDATGVCRVCIVASDCPQPATCNAKFNCVAACCSSADCTADVNAPVCDPNTSTCVACSATTPCTSGTCDPDSGRCVECNLSEECPAAVPACVDQRCRECDASHPCDAPQTCQSSQCVG